MIFLREHQLNIMLFMSGICFILAFMTMVIRPMPKKKKSILILLEISSMVMLIIEREAYIYRGNISDKGYFMVRFCNGIVFFLTLFIPHLITLYLEDAYRNEGKLSKTPIGLQICKVLFVAGTILIIISQFTGLYYTFNEQNMYVRSPMYPLSYAGPSLIVLLQECVIIKYRKKLQKIVTYTLLIIIALPSIVSVAQIFFYGISLTSIATVMVVIVFYIFVLLNLNNKIKEAREKEINAYIESKKKETLLFEQTVEALTNAIDAKDKYTQGHSARVADISRKIAKAAGYSEKKCNELFFSALLHDIGKIGIPDTIINKEGRLTDEEFEQIKLHPYFGYQILSSIKQSPTLSVGAHYHHERYDGTGYPDGLSKEDIPEYARIITVADAYDAMSSTRSYRDKLPKDKIKQELKKGMGTQFDPKFAKIMLEIIKKEPDGPKQYKDDSGK